MVLSFIRRKRGEVIQAEHVNELQIAAEQLDAEKAAQTAVDALETEVAAKLPIADVLNEPDMATGATDKPPSQASVTEYVDNEITDRNLLSAINEADFASNSASHVPTQQSTGLYVRDTVAELRDEVLALHRAADVPVYAPTLLLRPEVQRDTSGDVAVTLHGSVTEVDGEYGRAWNLTSALAAAGVSDVPVASVMGEAEGTIVGKFRVNSPTTSVWEVMGWNYNADGMWVRHRPATPNFTVRAGNRSRTPTTNADWSDWTTIALAYVGGQFVYVVNGTIMDRFSFETLGTYPATTFLLFSTSAGLNADMEFYVAYDRRLPDEALIDLTTRTDQLTWRSAHYTNTTGIVRQADGPGMDDGVEIAYDDPAIPIIAGKPVLQTNWDLNYWRNGSNSQGVVTPFMREFMLDGEAFAFSFNAHTSTEGMYDIRVDGESVTGGPQLVPVSSLTGQTWERVDFGSRAIRHVQIWFSLLNFGRVVIGPTDSIWAPDEPLGPRVVVLGDSLTAGVGADSRITGYVYTLAREMGWRDVWNMGIGGSGYANPGSPLTLSRIYGDRVPDDVIPATPDIVIVQGSTNDHDYADATVQANATSVYSAIQTAHPDATLIVVLPFGTQDAPSALVEHTRDAVLAAATGVADLIIDPIAENWFDGDGYVGGETGDGNADRYAIADGHPSQAGHDYIGYRIAAKIKASGILG